MERRSESFRSKDPLGRKFGRTDTWMGGNELLS
jgi:hypothetical protein